MRVETVQDGHVRVEFAHKEGEELAEIVLQNADRMSSALLDLANLLKQAKYEAENEFRQPPHAFDEHAPKAPSVKT